MESAFIFAVIDAHEGRDVACFDNPEAFLHADVDEDNTIVLKGRLAELMVQVAPNLYRKYITVHSRQEGNSHTLHQDAEGSVRALEECLALVQ